MSLGDLNVEKVKTVISKPFVYGNTARYLQKKRDEDGRTHEWCIFLQPYNDEDMSKYVKKVQFKLHDSYEEPVRIFTKAPFEVIETGWGEFEMGIKIFFTDPNEKPLTITYLLKLFHHTDHEIITGKKDLVKEIYDEMVFVNPSPQFYEDLTIVVPSPVILRPLVTDFDKERKQSHQNIRDLKQKTIQEVASLKEILIQRKSAVDQCKTFMEDLE